MDVRLPRLLTPDLAEKARLRPSAGSATMSLEPLSTASLTLPEGEPEAAVRDFIELYGPDGSLGVFRVSAARGVCGGARQLQLEHGACTLGDCVTAPDTVLTGSARAMLEALLRCQSRVYWALGDVEITESLADIDAGGASVLEAVVALARALPEAMLCFDQTAFPWRLHLRRKPTSVGSECRLNRNLQGVTVTVDDASLCTRVTIEDGEGARATYDADTIGTWGAVHRFIAAQTDDAASEARRYLDEHKHPAVSVELDALALSRLTGEPRDRFTLGHLCRAALPEWGTVMDERIVTVAYPDLYGQPGLARLTLCSRRADTATYLGRLSSAAARASRGLRSAFRHIRETDDSVSILAGEIDLRATKEEVGKYFNEVYIRLDANDASLTLHAEHLDEVDRSLSEAGIRLDGLNADLQLWAAKTERNGERISAALIDLDGANARITAQATRIDKVEGSVSQARLDLDGANAAISAQATRIDKVEGSVSQAQLDLDGANAAISAQASKLDAQGRQISAAELRMDGLAATIDLKVSKDGLISAINMSPEQIRIAASKVVLDGFVTASQLAVTNATIANLMAGREIATSIVTDNIGVNNHLTVYGHQADWYSRSFGTSLTDAAERVVQRENITYMGPDGQSHFVSVVTGITNLNSQPTLNKTTYRFMGYGN